MRSSKFLPDSTSNALDVLTRARARIARGNNWTQNTAARDQRGFRCSAKSPDARCWCILGAVAAEGGSVVACETLRRHADGDVAEFNDTTSHAAVLRLVDRAIASLRAARS